MIFPYFANMDNMSVKIDCIASAAEQNANFTKAKHIQCFASPTSYNLNDNTFD